MKAKYSFTFEFDVAQPETVRGEVEATSLPTLFARAAREAKQYKPRMYWRSAVCVLERTEGMYEETPEVEEDSEYKLPV